MGYMTLFMCCDKPHFKFNCETHRVKVLQHINANILYIEITHNGNIIQPGILKSSLEMNRNGNFSPG